MSTRRRTTFTWLSALSLGLASFVLLRPDIAQAGDCDTINVPCHIDSSLWTPALSLVRFFWEINRALLLVARSIESLRQWLIVGEESLLGSAFGVLTERLWGPLYIVALFAIVLFILGYLVSAFVEANWVNVRKAIQNGFLAALLFTVGSQALSATEALRDGVGTMMSGIAQTVLAPSSPVKFYAASDTFVAPSGSIYGPDDRTCPGMSTARPTELMQLNDLAANYFFADARDIHCPSDASGLPIRSGSDISFTEIYVHDPRGENNASVRAESFNLLAKGQQRVVLGLVLSGAAVIEQLLYAIFAVALASTWFALAIGLIFALFSPMQDMASRPIQAMFAILKASWMTSLAMGFVVALISQAAATGNELVTVGMGGIGGFTALALMKSAFGSAKMAAGALSTVAGGAPAAIAGAVSGIVKGAVTVGTAVATGGASLGLAGAGKGLRANRGTTDSANTADAVMPRRVRRSSQAPTTTSQIAHRGRPVHTPRMLHVSENRQWYDTALDAPPPSSAGKTTVSLDQPKIVAPAMPLSLKRRKPRTEASQAENTDTQAPRLNTVADASAQVSTVVPVSDATPSATPSRYTTRRLEAPTDKRAEVPTAHPISTRQKPNLATDERTETPPNREAKDPRLTKPLDTVELTRQSTRVEVEQNNAPAARSAADPQPRTRREVHAPNRQLDKPTQPGEQAQPAQQPVAQPSVQAPAAPQPVARPRPQATRRPTQPGEQAQPAQRPTRPGEQATQAQRPTQPGEQAQPAQQPVARPKPQASAAPQSVARPKPQARPTSQPKSSRSAPVEPVQRIDPNNLPPTQVTLEHTAAEQAEGIYSPNPVQRLDPNNLPPDIQAALNQAAAQAAQPVQAAKPVQPVRQVQAQRIGPNNLPPTQVTLEHMAMEQAEDIYSPNPVQKLDPNNLPPDIQATLNQAAAQAAAQPVQAAQPVRSAQPVRHSTSQAQPNSRKRKEFSLSRRKKRP